MTEPVPTDADVREAARRSRRRAEVFGDVLPDQTSDDAAAPTAAETRQREDDLRREVPPHHGS